MIARLASIAVLVATCGAGVSRAQAGVRDTVGAVTSRVAAARAVGWKRVLPVLFKSRWRFDGEGKRWVGRLGADEVSVRAGWRDRLWGQALWRGAGVTPSEVEYRSVFASWRRRSERRRAFEAIDELALRYTLPPGARAFLLAVAAQHGVTQLNRLERYPRQGYQSLVNFGVRSRARAGTNLLVEGDSDGVVVIAERTRFFFHRHTRYPQQSVVRVPLGASATMAGPVALGETLTGVAVDSLAPADAPFVWTLMVESLPADASALWAENPTDIARALRESPPLQSENRHYYVLGDRGQVTDAFTGPRSEDAYRRYWGRMLP